LTGTVTGPDARSRVTKAKLFHPKGGRDSGLPARKCRNRQPQEDLQAFRPKASPAREKPANAASRGLAREAILAMIRLFGKSAEAPGSTEAQFGTCGLPDG
jgi:hypothetical protein